MLAALQDDFALALLDPERPVPDGAHVAHRTARRRDASRSIATMSSSAWSMRCARASPPPSASSATEFFAAMARVFVTAHPPRSPMLITATATSSATFIETFEPVRELSYLPDVARLEAARTRAYHAADAAAARCTSYLQSLDPETSVERCARCCIRRCEVVRSPHPIVTIWGMNSGETRARPGRHGCGRGCAGGPSGACGTGARPCRRAARRFPGRARRRCDASAPRRRKPSARPAFSTSPPCWRSLIGAGALTEIGLLE